VDYAGVDPESGGIEVVPKEGKKIVFSPLLTGSNEFLNILREHCRMW
jgi:hypothetical protein